MLLDAMVNLKTLVILWILVSYKMLCLGWSFSNKFLSSSIRWGPGGMAADGSWTLLCTTWIKEVWTDEVLHPSPALWENFHSLKRSNLCVTVLHSCKSSRLHVHGGDQVIFYWNCSIHPILIFSFYLCE